MSKFEVLPFTIYNKDPLFWNSLKEENSCWIFTLKHGTANGYGMVKRNGYSIMAHCYAFKLFNGHYPSDKCLHSCDVRRCCNPYHLFEGSQRDNLIDAVLKGRNKSAKFTPETVNVLREEYASRRYTMRQLASKYSVSSSTISNIINRKKWDYV